MCWTKWPPPLSHRRGMGIMKLKISLFKKWPFIFPRNYLQYLNACFGNEELSLWSTAARKRSEKWEKMLKPLWMEVVFFHLNPCMSAEMLSTSLQHFQMQRYIMTCIYRHAHVFHTLRLVPSLTQVRSRHHFLWCWLKMRKISPTGAENHCKPNHFCLKVTARSKKCATCRK